MGMTEASDWQSRPPASRALAGDGGACWPRRIPRQAQHAALESLRQGAGVVVTGQQVGLFGGPLFTPFKAATAIARARQATAAGRPHVAIFWLASEDHDFAEINHVTFPARRELRKLVYPADASSARPVGPMVLDESIAPLLDQAWELLGSSDAMDALAEAYKPGRTFAQAFADFYAKVFAAQGLLILDAGGRDIHRMGAPVLRAAIERADEFHVRSGRTQSGTGSRRISRPGGGGAAIEPAVPDRRAQPARAWRSSGSAPSASEPAGFVAGGPAKVFHRRSARHSRRRAGAHFAFGASAACLSGLSALHVAHHRRPCGDRLFCAIGGAVRAHSGPHDSGAAALFSDADRARHRRTSAQARTHAGAGLLRNAGVADATRWQRAPFLSTASESLPMRATRSTANSKSSWDGCARSTRAWAARPRLRRARCATR